ncbi:MAG: transcription antitermination factor NusB [Crocinitomicaceae bacterium]|nr:transcription antitermination factor NusB [Crocinitomicaceae bacterium]
MFNRRQLRIKVLQALYALHSDKEGSVEDAHKLLMSAVEKTYDLYLTLLLLIAEMQDAAIERIEAGRMRKQPSHEDLHPNTKFVNNKPLRVVIKSKVLAKEAANRSLGWSNDQDMVKRLFKSLVASEEYVAYMENEERGFQHDRESLNRMFRKHIINDESLQEWLEEQSILWSDDLDLASSIVLKTIKTISEDSDDLTLCDMWKEEGDDKEFLEQLFSRTLALSSEHDKAIEEAASNWDIERIATIDLLLLRMALAEARSFESVPLKVTINEYIDLAKFYSTEKSGAFVNGVLDKLFASMREDGSIVKTGRGLIE